MNHIWIDPIILHLGPLQVRWYGLMYVLGFFWGAYLIKVLSKEGFSKIKLEKIDSLVTYLIVGMFFGARIIYVTVYNWDYFRENPSKIIAVWEGGLSFHGAMIGMVIAAFLFSKKNALHFFEVTDVIGICAAPGLFFGRMGNFINGELWGRVTDVPWGMVFPDAGPYPRHPSQLYEGLMEGIILFLILWFARKKVSYHGIISALFLFLYGLFRLGIEFFREPDAQLGFFLGAVTMGQILCFMMMVAGIIFFFWAKKIKRPISPLAKK